ncbi:MAG: hypothetical protein E5X53_26400 [Mesorhizobium sp.]|uniref:hypothetical protein n=1 Tax=Mesorhizobium sp. TaxID=1871066 RepID=UPI00121F85E3|nr:hypothetical protein [Mesorhizobium sp.]TIP70595.1 MAG: hypothetical protein E5X55_26650 [Mesorhizobium sp.]TIR49029.1 MAG: hypothetical protein E5X53_26400 [Mesorhizobium sp.]TJV94864.1 MAG: hypothetical protein E5X52_26925 [Mesorhizobium sp.]
MAENGEPRHYQDPVTAQLGERVTNMGRRINDVEVEMRAGFSQLGSTLAASTNETRQSIAALSTTLAERNRPQYQALGFGLSVILAVGALAYWPMRESTNDLKARNTELVQSIQVLSAETNKSIQALAANTVSRQEMDWRSERGTEDRKRTDESVASLRDTMVYRNEWQERNLSRDHDIENIRADAVREVANLQRQIDQQRSDFQLFSNSLGNGRDFITDLKSEVSRLRDQFAALTAKVAAEQNRSPP